MFTGDRVSVGEDAEVLEKDGGGGCTTVNEINATERTLKMVKMLKFMLHIFSHTKNL